MDVYNLCGSFFVLISTLIQSILLISDQKYLDDSYDDQITKFIISINLIYIFVMTFTLSCCGIIFFKENIKTTFIGLIFSLIIIILTITLGYKRTFISLIIGPDPSEIHSYPLYILSAIYINIYLIFLIILLVYAFFPIYERGRSLLSLIDMDELNDITIPQQNYKNDDDLIIKFNDTDYSSTNCYDCNKNHNNNSLTNNSTTNNPTNNVTTNSTTTDTNNTVDNIIINDGFYEYYDRNKDLENNETKEAKEIKETKEEKKKGFFNSRYDQEFTYSCLNEKILVASFTLKRFLYGVWNIIFIILSIAFLLWSLIVNFNDENNKPYGNLIIGFNMVLLFILTHLINTLLYIKINKEVCRKIKLYAIIILLVSSLIFLIGLSLVTFMMVVIFNHVIRYNSLFVVVLIISSIISIIILIITIFVGGYYCIKFLIWIYECDRPSTRFSYYNPYIYSRHNFTDYNRDSLSDANNIYYNQFT